MHTTDSELSSKGKSSVLRSIFSRSASSASVDRIPQSGDLIQLDGFGGCFELTDGHQATLQNLVEISVGGVILFTYPKANTPGCKFRLPRSETVRRDRRYASVTAFNCSTLLSLLCGGPFTNATKRCTIWFRLHCDATGTAQACLFRDVYQHLRSLGFAVYGLSKDTPKANSYFRSKHNLPFSLICDTRGCLIDALGFTKRPFGILRGVVVIDKDGRILTSVAGTPDATVKAVYEVCGDDIPLFPPTVGAQSIAETVTVVQGKGHVDDWDKQEVVETLADVVGKVNITASRLDTGAGYV